MIRSPRKESIIELMSAGKQGRREKAMELSHQQRD